MNYAFYTASVAGVVLIATDIPNPSDLDAEARRVMFTFIGVGIAVGVMLLATCSKSAPRHGHVPHRLRLHVGRPHPGRRGSGAGLGEEPVGRAVTVCVTYEPA